MMIDEGYSHIGALLRQAREDMHLTLDYASQQLHIRARYLQALEEGRISDIPGVAYAKGYLQAYAGFLQLDKNEVVRRFENMEGMLGRQGFFFPQVFSKEKHVEGHVVVGSLLFALLAYGCWALFLKPAHMPISVVDKPISIQERKRISAAMAADVACLKPQKELYPACYLLTRQSVKYLPLSRQMSTIMELARKP